MNLGSSWRLPVDVDGDDIVGANVVLDLSIQSGGRGSWFVLLILSEVIEASANKKFYFGFVYWFDSVYFIGINQGKLKWLKELLKNRLIVKTLQK
jgi:hypothetical protein